MNIFWIFQKYVNFKNKQKILTYTAAWSPTSFRNLQNAFILWLDSIIKNTIMTYLLFYNNNKLLFRHRSEINRASLIIHKPFRHYHIGTRLKNIFPLARVRNNKACFPLEWTNKMNTSNSRDCACACFGVLTIKTIKSPIKAF